MIFLTYSSALRSPSYLDAHIGRGVTLQHLNRHTEALESFDRVIALAPERAQAHYNRASILHELQRFDEALESYRRALETDPDHVWLQDIFLHSKMRLYDWSMLEPQLSDLTSRIEQGKPASPPIPKRERRAKLRVGYYSADYYNHATAQLAAGLFERHDREKFEIVAFNFGRGQHDSMTERLRCAFDRFVDVRGKTDLQIASLSRDLEIDIAVDLKGFTHSSRAGIFAHRAAPIQVSYLGYPGTMAAPFMDYLVADATLIPPEARAHYTEKVVYLPGSYQVNDRSRPIAQRPWSRADFGLPDQAFVFCSFNNVYKITPVTFDCWMRILRRVEGSVLWLIEDNDTAISNLRAAVRSRGVDPARLIFSSRLLAPDHLARHRLANLFIDTFPCNAHTTASDALWAGLPVLTRAGESFPARVAASLVNAIGLPELVAGSLAQYEELAVQLQDPVQLAGIAQRLRDNRLTAPLFDTDSFTRNLEQAYSDMYERYQADAALEDIYISC